jgi:hypothetical protein
VVGLVQGGLAQAHVGAKAADLLDHQLPITPPSILRITTFAERGAAIGLVVL